MPLWLCEFPRTLNTGSPVSENWVSRELVNREGRSRTLVLVPTRTNYLLTERVTRVIFQLREAFMYIAIALHLEEEQQ